MLQVGPMAEALAAVAPGTPLRDALDRVLQADRGALIVLGDGPAVLAICSGGFLVDTELTPQRLSEVAKMDGAIILSADATRIARANVHLVPDPTVFTAETGTRHRTAERVARSIGVPVISVSEDQSIITVYRGSDRHQLQATSALVTKANQALQTLERYKARLDEVGASLSALEVEDFVTVRDVATVLQRAEMVRRISEEIQGYLVELGADGRLIRLQHDELMGGVTDDRRLVIKDYLSSSPAGAVAAQGSAAPGGSGIGGGPGPDLVERALDDLAAIPTEDLFDLEIVAATLRLSGQAPDLDASLRPRGFRLLSKIPRLADGTTEAILGHFANLQEVMRASRSELCDCVGIEAERAQAVKEGLSKLTEISILDRYR